MTQISVDISGRPSLNFTEISPTVTRLIPQDVKYTFEDAKHFLQSFVNNCGMNMHISIKSSSDLHHILEAIFKALGIALDKATQIDLRRQGVPSTKGKI